MASTTTAKRRPSLIAEVRSRKTLPSPHEARAIREKAQVTQQRLGEELGVHRVTIARWEAGLRRPVGRLKDAYADLLAQLRELVA